MQSHSPVMVEAAPLEENITVDVGLEDAFEGAAVYVQTSLPAEGSGVSTEAQLQLYGLYKQATVGDAPEKGPSMLAFDQKARHKWCAATACLYCCTRARAR